MAHVKNRITALLRPLADRLKADFAARYGRDIVLTDRMKLLISVAFGILLFSAIVGTHQLVAGLERRHARAQVDLERLRIQIESGSWHERKQQSQILKSLLEDRLWTAQTSGLADASFERWLRDRLNRYRVEPLQQIQVRRIPVGRQSQPGEAAQPLANVQRMTAKLVLPFNGATVAGLLADLADADKAVVVDRLTVRSGRNARVEMDVSAFYRSAEPG